MVSAGREVDVGPSAIHLVSGDRMISLICINYAVTRSMEAIATATFVPAPGFMALSGQGEGRWIR